MIPFLNPLKENIWLRTSLSAFFLSVFGVSSWILLTAYIPEDMKIFVLIGLIIILLVISLIIGKLISGFAIAPTDFLARAVLTVTNEENNIDPPKIDDLNSSSRDFLADTIEKIYSLKSYEPTTDEFDELSYFKTVTNLLPLPMIALDNNQEVTFINKVAQEYLGFSANDIVNKPIHDVFNIEFTSPNTLEEWVKEVSENSVTATETWQRVRLTLPDGQQKKFDLVVRYSKNDPNGIELVLAIYDRTLLYERDDRDLTFVSLAVHELRTPVTILRGYIEVFEDELGPKLDSEQTSFMHNMSASAQQLTSFVSNILNVARIEENALTMQLKEEDWSEVLGQVCKDMGLRAKVHGKKLILNIDENLPKVAVDRVSIYEVIANIIENAIKYTHTDEEIVINTYLKNDCVETTITDKGIGIPSSIIGHVFDKFYRSHSSKNSVGGTGLGLFLSKAIIDAHGGQLWVKSKEGKGSTFGFTIQQYSNIADQLKDNNNGEIIRGAHGWIKNHSLYRG